MDCHYWLRDSLSEKPSFPPASSVILNKFLNFSRPQFLTCETEVLRGLDELTHQKHLDESLCSQCYGTTISSGPLLPSPQTSGRPLVIGTFMVTQGLQATECACSL